MTPKQWRDAAIADGWTSEPLYGNTTGECANDLRLMKDGFTAQVYLRKRFDNKEITESLYLWGPDRLAIDPPIQYDWSVIQAKLLECLYCKAKNVETERVGFAGRSCKECIQDERKKQEFPGWYN